MSDRLRVGEPSRYVTNHPLQVYSAWPSPHKQALWVPAKARRFYSCSVAVKLRLFKSFCLCFYDAALWDNFTAGSLDKLRSAYVKCIKVFFGYAKYYSVTTMLTELNLQKFNTVIDKCRSNFQFQIPACENGIVQHFVHLHLMWLILCCIAV